MSLPEKENSGESTARKSGWGKAVAVTAIGATLVVFTWSPSARNWLLGKEDPNQPISCSEAQPADGKEVELGEKATRVAVKVDDKLTLEMGAFQVKGEKVMIQEGAWPPEALTIPKIVLFSPNGKPVTEVSAEVTEDHDLKVICDPEGQQA